MLVGHRATQYALEHWLNDVPAGGGRRRALRMAARLDLPARQRAPAIVIGPFFPSTRGLVAAPSIVGV